MSAIVKGLMGAVAKQYQGIVASRCAAMGTYFSLSDRVERLCNVFHSNRILLFRHHDIILTVHSIGVKYEDLLLENEDLEHALNRIPHNVKVER